MGVQDFSQSGGKETFLLANFRSKGDRQLFQRRKREGILVARSVPTTFGARDFCFFRAHNDRHARNEISG